MSLRQHPLTQKRKPLTVPAMRAVTTGVTANGKAASVVIPAGAVTGDLGVFFVHTVGAGNESLTPAGLTLVSELITPTGLSAPDIRVFTKWIVAGDAGATITFTSKSANNRCIIIACCVYRDTQGFSVLPSIRFNTQNEVSANEAIQVPCTYSGAQDLIVGASSSISANGNINPAAQQAVTLPSGMTARAFQSTQSNGLSVGNGLNVWDGPSRYPQSPETLILSHNNQVWYETVSMALAPIGTPWAEKERVSASLSGGIVYGYGNSSLNRVRPGLIPIGDPNAGYNSLAGWYWRIAAAMGNNAASNNMAMSGSLSVDITTGAYSTASMPTQDVSGSLMCVTQPLTYYSKPKPNLVLTDLFGNDLFQDDTNPTRRRASCALAIESIFRLIRSDTFKFSDDASIAYSGTWGNLTGDGYSNNKVAQATVAGAKATITTTATDIDLVLLAQDDSAGATDGGPYSIVINGGAPITGTTSNAMLTSPWGGGKKYTWCHMTIPIHGMPSGTNTVEVTFTGTSPQALHVQGYLIPSATPPWIVISSGAALSAATLTALGVTAAQASAYLQIIKDAVAKFTDGRVIIYDPNASGLWDASTMTFTDGVHPSELGTAFYAHEIMRMLSERVA